MSKTKFKKLAGDFSLDKIGGLFNNMLGLGTVESKVAYDKGSILLKVIDKLHTLVDAMITMHAMRAHFPEVVADFERVAAVINDDKAHRTITVSVDVKMSDDDAVLLSDQYKALKLCESMKIAREIWNELKPHSKYLAVDSDDAYEFILKMESHKWEPFVFSSFNAIEFCRSDEIGVESKRLLFIILSKMGHITEQAWDVMSSPDVDIDVCANMIIRAITELRTHPELCRCTKAFNYIEKSIDLLKANLRTYYLDFICTGNDKIMYENYILDVANTNDGDIELVRQIASIMKFYKRHSNEVSQLMNKSTSTSHGPQHTGPNYDVIMTGTGNLIDDIMKRATNNNNGDDSQDALAAYISEIRRKDRERKAASRVEDIYMQERRASENKTIDELVANIENDKGKRKNKKKK